MTTTLTPNRPPDLYTKSTWVALMDAVNQVAGRGWNWLPFCVYTAENGHVVVSCRTKDRYVVWSEPANQFPSTETVGKVVALL